MSLILIFNPGSSKAGHCVTRSVRVGASIGACVRIKVRSVRIKLRGAVFSAIFKFSSYTVF